MKEKGRKSPLTRRVSLRNSVDLSPRDGGEVYTQPYRVAFRMR
jgi:hypothetical protein